MICPLFYYCSLIVTAVSENKSLTNNYLGATNNTLECLLFLYCSISIQSRRVRADPIDLMIEILHAMRKNHDGETVSLNISVPDVALFLQSVQTPRLNLFTLVSM